MKKTRLIPVILIILMAMTVIAFAGAEPANKEIDQNLDPSVIEPGLPDSSECMEAPLYIGKILSVLEDGSILTVGMSGIEGQVVVHLPDSVDPSLVFTEDAYLTTYYDGTIAESFPLQIWSTVVKSVDLDMPEIPAETVPPVLIQEPVTETPEESLFIGIIKESKNGSVLTEGIFGIKGDVIVHLPKNTDPEMELPEGYLISLTYDGKVARSLPAQIWAIEISAVEENQVISLDPIENPMLIEGSETIEE